MSVVDDIKSRLDLIDFVSQTVKLRKAGKNYTGFCPFHSNTRTPAFVVFPETQTWRCFGQCNEGGDLFGYVMKREGWDFAETLRYLAERAGVTLTQYERPDAPSASEQERLQQLLEATVQFFRERLMSPAGSEALAYLRKRGLTDETIKVWGLGFAPAGWNELGTELKRKGFDDAEMVNAGVANDREGGGTFDKFRNRLMFPIRDAYGKMNGFGGRVLDPNDLPKYMNSPRTELFDKGRLLYGMDLARQSIRNSGQAVIVEGYMDVIGLHQAGYTNAISPMGTALTEDQFRLLKRFTRSVVLALDPDAAGERATLKGLETARQTMDLEGELRFDAKGLLHVENRLNADVRVTTLPDGVDPDEIVLQDPQRWQAIMDEAKPVVVHVMQALTRGQDLEDAKVKREIAGQVLPLIEDVADAVERESYRQQLARLLRVDERALRTQHQTQRATRRNRRNETAAEPAPKVEDNRFQSTADRNRLLEQHTIVYLLERPEDLYKLDKQLAGLGLEHLNDGDFSGTDRRLAFGVVRDALRQDAVSAQDYIAEHLPAAAFDVAPPKNLLDPDQSSLPEPSAEKVLGDQVRNILRLRQNLVEGRTQQILYLQSETEEKPYTDEEAHFLMVELLNQRRLIDLALKGMDGSPSQASRLPNKWRRG